MFFPENLIPLGNGRSSAFAVSRCRTPTLCGGSAAMRTIARFDLCSAVKPASEGATDALNCRPSIKNRSESGSPISLSNRDSLMLVIGSTHVPGASCKNAETGKERKLRQSA
eukprot:2350283-Prymnesium_polylepis.1